MIDAVELESEAAAQAQEISTSPRGQSGLMSIRRIFCVDHTADSTLRFNHQQPTLLSQGVECATPQREQARYTTTLVTHRC